MKKYLFSYQNVYGERCYVVAYGNNVHHARSKINMSVTYRGIASYDDSMYSNTYGAVFYR